MRENLFLLRKPSDLREIYRPEILENFLTSRKMEQIIANLLVADNDVIQKVSWLSTIFLQNFEFVAKSKLEETTWKEIFYN